LLWLLSLFFQAADVAPPRSFPPFTIPSLLFDVHWSGHLIKTQFNSNMKKKKKKNKVILVCVCESSGYLSVVVIKIWWIGQHHQSRGNMVTDSSSVYRCWLSSHCVVLFLCVSSKIVQPKKRKLLTTFNKELLICFDCWLNQRLLLCTEIVSNNRVKFCSKSLRGRPTLGGSVECVCPRLFFLPFSFS
jgi:hypothetical protein